MWKPTCGSSRSHGTRTATIVKERWTYAGSCLPPWSWCHQTEQGPCQVGAMPGRPECPDCGGADATGVTREQSLADWRLGAVCCTTERSPKTPAAPLSPTRPREKGPNKSVNFLTIFRTVQNLHRRPVAVVKFFVASFSSDFVRVGLGTCTSEPRGVNVLNTGQIAPYPHITGSVPDRGT